jgi:hypothetical protein
MQPSRPRPLLNEHRRRLYARFLERFERALRVREARATRRAETGKRLLVPAPAHERCTGGRPSPKRVA